jgi:hypothetical protein
MTDLPKLYVKAKETYSVLDRSSRKWVDQTREVFKIFYPGCDNMCDMFEHNKLPLVVLKNCDIILGRYNMSYCSYIYTRVTPEEIYVKIDDNGRMCDNNCIKLSEFEVENSED